MEGQVLGAVIAFGTANLGAITGMVMLIRKNGRDVTHKTIQEHRDDCPFASDIMELKRDVRETKNIAGQNTLKLVEITQCLKNMNGGK